MTDRIFIKGLTLHAYHGVMSHEAKVGQTFSIDIELDIDLSDAARSDKVADTVLSAFPRVEKVAVTIHKPHAPVAATFSDVGVHIVRARPSRK